MMSKFKREGGASEMTLLCKGHYINFGQGGREGFKTAQKNSDIIYGRSPIVNEAFLLASINLITM